MNLAKNNVLRKDGRDVVLIDVVRHELTSNQLAVVVHPLDEKNAVPEVWLREDLQHWFNEKQIGHVARQVVQSGSTAPSASKVQEQRWLLICDIVGREELYFRSTRHKLLQDHAKALKSTPEHLLSLLRLYWSRGQVRQALSGEYHRCGRVDPSRPHALTIEKKGERGSTEVHFLVTGGASRGRKPVLLDYEPYNPPAEMAKLILKVGCAKFLEDEIVSIRKTADHVLNVLFSEKDEDGNPIEDQDGCAVLKPLGQRPSFHQIEYRLSKALSDSERYRKRVTRGLFSNNHAATLGTALDDCNGPGDIYEIDATIVDCYVVAEADRTTILGKCTLYLVIDRFSKLIVGFYITLGSPSWEGAKLATLSCFGDWEMLCKRLGVTYRPEAFPAKGICPNRFVADRGEALSIKSNMMCDGMHIEVTNLPAQNAKGKGSGVEVGFKETHVQIKDEVPGYHPPKNATRRQGKKSYEKDACLTVTQLAAVYLEGVMTRNLTIRTGRTLTPKQLLTGFKATPVNLWNQGVEQQMSLLAAFDYGYVRTHLLPISEATVTQSGVLFRDLFYKFDDILARDWATRAALRGNYPVRVRYSPESTNGILIEDPDNLGQFILAELTSKSAVFKNISFEEAGLLTKLQRKSNAEGEEQNQRRRMGSANRISKVTIPAYTSMKEATKGVGLGPRTRNSVEMRAAEHHAMKAQEHDLTGDGSHVIGGALNLLPIGGPKPTKAAPQVGVEKLTPTANALLQHEVNQASSTLGLLFDNIDNYQQS